MIITGDPGEAWFNSTAYVHWQRHASYIRVCGYCLGLDGHISDVPWDIPSHGLCRCWQDAIAPGDTADPFTNYRKVLAGMDDAGRQHAIGKANWLLLKAKAITWDDVFGPQKIRTLQEVVRHAKLTVADLIKIGIAAYIAEQAWMAVHRPETVRQKAVAAKQATTWGPELESEVGEPKLAKRPPWQGIAGGLAVLKAIGRTSEIEIPDFGGSVAAMRAWVAKTFPGAAISDDDWALLIILVEEQDRYKKMLKRLKVDEAKGMKAIGVGQ